MKYKLPAYIIIGEARCGTTSLYSMMTQHPKIKAAINKEIYFFSNDNWWKKDEYLRRLGKCGENQIIGEATPMYMWKCDTVPKRIKKIVPEAKFIVLLRNPVDKVYSHLVLGKHGVEVIRDFLDTGKSLYMQFERAKYYEFLKEWFKIFPRKQFKIIKSEALFKSPKKICNEVFEFLGLENYEINPLCLNKVNYPTLPDDIKNRLKEYYRPYNQELYELLDRGFNWENE